VSISSDNSVKPRSCGNRQDAGVASRRRRKKKQDPAGAQGLVEAAKRTDANPQLVAAAKFIRGLLPGDDPEKSRLPLPMQRLVTELEPERESTMHQIGIGALQAWQALSEAQRRGRGEADVAILFTDLVGFSDWALEAGDEASLELLRLVGDAEQRAVSDQGGAVVKRLGDGSMAVFSRAEQAVAAALEAQEGAAEIEVEGYAPSLRAGVHQGRPQKVKGDFLGIDVNIAARVGDAANGGEVLVSGTVREELDGRRFKFGRERTLEAPGAPADLTVCSVKRKAAPSRRRRPRGSSRRRR
jgi:adenylate cyclase